MAAQQPQNSQAALAGSRTLTNNDQSAKLISLVTKIVLLNGSTGSDAVRLRIEKNAFSPTAFASLQLAPHHGGVSTGLVSHSHVVSGERGYFVCLPLSRSCARTITNSAVRRKGLAGGARSATKLCDCDVAGPSGLSLGRHIRRARTL